MAKHIAGVMGAYHRKDGYWEGNGYRVSWCLGHLTEMAPPEVYDPKYKKWEMEDLPILPDPWILQADASKTRQLEILYDLMNREETKCIVNACDAGREGELIFRNVYELSKSTVPVKRLWLNSMEEDAIYLAFENMRPGSDYDALAEAARCRARADWLVGINASRAYSIHYGDRMRIGRVQTPTLVMITSREKEIENFEEKLTWTVELHTEQGLVVKSDPFEQREEASKLSAECVGEYMKITKVETKETPVKTPKLYDLTTLQREANRYYGYSAKQTLDLLQDLYDNKLITYPRTDSRFCTRDMEFSVMQALNAIPEFDGFAEMQSEGNVSRVLDNSKVTDHTAILPTKQLIPAVFREQSPEAQNLLRLILLRLLEATNSDGMVQTTAVEAQCHGVTFHAHGAQVIRAGFQALDKLFFQRFLPEYEKDPERIPSEGFQGLEQGQVIAVSDVNVEKHVSKPPKHDGFPDAGDTVQCCTDRGVGKQTAGYGAGKRIRRAVHDGDPRHGAGTDHACEGTAAGEDVIQSVGRRMSPMPVSGDGRETVFLLHQSGLQFRFMEGEPVSHSNGEGIGSGNGKGSAGVRRDSCHGFLFPEKEEELYCGSVSGGTGQRFRAV